MPASGDQYNYWKNGIAKLETVLGSKITLPLHPPAKGWRNQSSGMGLEGKARICFKKAKPLILKIRNVDHIND